MLGEDGGGISAQAYDSGLVRETDHWVRGGIQPAFTSPFLYKGQKTIG